MMASAVFDMLAWFRKGSQAEQRTAERADAGNATLRLHGCANAVII